MSLDTVSRSNAINLDDDDDDDEATYADMRCVLACCVRCESFSKK